MTTTEANDIGLARTHRATWMTIIRQSLERSVPLASDNSFDDLLEQLDAIPARPIKGAATPDGRALASLAQRDAALEAHLSSHIGRLAKAFGRFYTQFAVPDPSPCR